MSAMQRGRRPGVISLGVLFFNGSNLPVTLESVIDLTYHKQGGDISSRRRGDRFAALLSSVALPDRGDRAGGHYGQCALAKALAAMLPGLGAPSTPGAAAHLG